MHFLLALVTGLVMALIDLTGITHPNASDGTFDIHRVTSSMVRKNKTENRLIILTVNPATEDISICQLAISDIEACNKQFHCSALLHKSF